MNKLGPMKHLIGHQSACPVCGKPRSTGIRFIDHGPCMEKLAAKAAEYHPERAGLDRLSDESKRKATYKEATKKYRTGKLPRFMFD